MKILDVTLRDGGFAVDFDWPLEFARTYYDMLSNMDEIEFIELGYWKQTKISRNTFYNLDFDKVINITKGQGRKNVSVMIDYHNCSKHLNDYPTCHQNEIGIIRLCSRQEDVPLAIKFGEKLQRHTGLKISFNVVKVSNYEEDEFTDTCQSLSETDFDIICFADTFGCLDLSQDFDKYRQGISILKDSKKMIGMHMHDHNGKSYFNSTLLEDLGFDYLDTSIRGMGKGAGNLKLEYIANNENVMYICELIRKYDKLLTLPYNPYCIITAKYSITDNYAEQAMQYQMSVIDFDKFCSTLEGLDKNNINHVLLKNYISNV
jgi:4-hydroxy 2-oxovalerate aldolase